LLGEDNPNPTASVASALTTQAIDDGSLNEIDHEPFLLFCQPALPGFSYLNSPQRRVGSVVGLTDTRSPGAPPLND
jgi:hypothetical protein